MSTAVATLLLKPVTVIACRFLTCAAFCALARLCAVSLPVSLVVGAFCSADVFWPAGESFRGVAAYATDVAQMPSHGCALRAVALMVGPLRTIRPFLHTYSFCCNASQTRWTSGGECRDARA